MSHLCGHQNLFFLILNLLKKIGPDVYKVLIKDMCVYAFYVAVFSRRDVPKMGVFPLNREFFPVALKNVISTFSFFILYTSEHWF